MQGMRDEITDGKDGDVCLLNGSEDIELKASVKKHLKNP